MVEYKIDGVEGCAEFVIAAAGTPTSKGVEIDLAIIGTANTETAAKITGDLVGTMAAKIARDKAADFLLMVNAAMMDAIIKEAGQE